MSFYELIIFINTELCVNTCQQRHCICHVQDTLTLWPLVTLG